MRFGGRSWNVAKSEWIASKGNQWNEESTVYVKIGKYADYYLTQISDRKI
jgi:hypothetical protein